MEPRVLLLRLWLGLDNSQVGPGLACVPDPREDGLGAGVEGGKYDNTW